MRKINFADWLNKELAERKMTQAELSKKSGISDGHISYLLSGTRRPGAAALGALAHAMEIPLNVMLQKAGYLPPTEEEIDQYREEIIQMIDEVKTDEEKRILRDRMKLELQLIRERRSLYGSK